MRVRDLATLFLAVGLLTLAVDPGVLAQEAASGGIGPFHLGMTLAEAEAVKPNANWRIEPMPGGDKALSGGLRFAVAGSQFEGVLGFHNDALASIILVGAAARPCTDAIPALVIQMEPEFGAFHSAPGPAEHGSLENVLRTPAGSEIRFVRYDNKLTVSSTRRRGSDFVEVLGQEAASAGCKVSLTFSQQSRQDSERGAVTVEELDRADSMLNPVFTRRPNGETYARVYPKGAIFAGIGGMANLDCLVAPNGSLSCRVALEGPAGAGFGDAALQAAESFRIDVRAGSAVGKRIRMPIRFVVEETPRAHE